MAKLGIRGYRPEDMASLIRLWQRCGLVAPQNHPRRDIERKLRRDPDGILVGELEGELAASCFFGYEGHRGWINYLAVDPKWRRSGFASEIMAEAESRLRALGCPKINLQVRSTNEQVVAFYQAIGFSIDPVVSLGKRLEPDPPWDGEA